MARMKTGRLTSKTTPPQKNNGGTTNPKTSSQGAWDKYEADAKAYSNYDNEVKAYNKQMESYKKSKLQGPADYRALDAGSTSDRNMRKLEAGELSEFNAYQKKNNPDAPNYSWVRVHKDTKRGEWGNFMGDVAKPTAPVRKEKPDPTNLPLDPMSYKSAGKIATKKGGIKSGKETPTRAEFVNPPKPRSYKSDKSNLRNDHRTLGVDYTAKVRTNVKTGRKKLVVDNVSLARKSAPKGYKREEKQFKAYAGQTATGDSFLDMTPKDIKAYRKEAKSTRAEYRKQPDSDTKAMGKAAMTSEIRQSRKAEKFSKKVYDFKDKGGVKFFNDKNYGGNIVKDYRESAQNAANRNTMDNKLKAIGDRSSKRRAELEKSKTGGFQYNQVNQ